MIVDRGDEKKRSGEIYTLKIIVGKCGYIMV
jgi:hypothetical protein